jgi:hypothetical protein
VEPQLCSINYVGKPQIPTVNDTGSHNYVPLEFSMIC